MNKIKKQLIMVNAKVLLLNKLKAEPVFLVEQKVNICGITVKFTSSKIALVIKSKANNPINIIQTM